MTLGLDRNIIQPMHRFFVIYGGKHPDARLQRMKVIVCLHYRRKSYRLHSLDGNGVRWQTRCQKKSPQMMVTGKCSGVEFSADGLSAKLIP